MPKKVGDLGKRIVAKGFKNLPKVQKNAQSGHTERELYNVDPLLFFCPMNAPQAPEQCGLV